jgi:hypothetical protein
MSSVFYMYEGSRRGAESRALGAVTAVEVAELEAAFPQDKNAGERYAPAIMKTIDR